MRLGDTASFTTQLTSNIKTSASADGAAYIQQATGVDVTQGRVASGISAAGQLAENGFDITSQADQQAMVAVIAGGLSLIPGVGPILGGALETLYQIAQPLACPTAKFFHDVGISQSDCDSPPCVVNGPVPTPDVLAANFAQPFLAKMSGSFAQFVNGALLVNAASALSCKSAVPPSVIVDAAVNMWNQTHAGPAQDFYVPPLLPMMPMIQQWSNGQNSYTGNLDPNLYYAFYPASWTPWGEDLSQAPAPPPMGNALSQNESFAAIYAQWPNEQYPSPARFVSVNVGNLLSETERATHTINLAPIVQANVQAAQAAMPTSSAGTTAVKAAAGTAAGLSVGALVVATVASYVVGKPVTKVLDIAWEKIKKAF